MNGLQIKTIDSKELKNCHFKIIYIEVIVDDWNNVSQGMIHDLLSKTWLSDIVDETARISFEARSAPTYSKIEKILKEFADTLNNDFGEYLISFSALKALELNMRFQNYPLAEFWKEKALGNPGFDFHSLDIANSLLFFGEAKFRSNVKSAHVDSIKQIREFIDKKKDRMELKDLKDLKSNHFKEEFCNQDHRCYVAAFSCSQRLLDVLNVISKYATSKLSNVNFPILICIGVNHTLPV